VEKTSVILKPEVIEFLEKLIDKLYKKNYFIHKENAKEYVDNLLLEIKSTIATAPHYTTPIQLKQYGLLYLKTKGGKRTVWYSFFNKKLNKYIIKRINNNHTASAQFLNLFN
jgi:hypothetical protein